MKHSDYKNFINLDCEKGLCALSKGMLPMDGEGSGACPKFVPAPTCGNCKSFENPDKYGVGTCTGLGNEHWAYGTCGASTCAGYSTRA